MKVINSLVMIALRKYVALVELQRGQGSPGSGVDYWEQRAREFGVRSVLNIGHSEKEIETVTQMQKDLVFPLLKQELRGGERVILDFGCGPGRFTLDLAEIIQGYAIGVDPIKHLLDLAPKNDNVEYRLMREGLIPVESASVDVIWLCLVLGGILDEAILRNTIKELDRVLTDEGLLFLVENTTEKKNAKHWEFRSVQTYKSLLKFVGLRHVSDYFDLGEWISIMAGRRRRS